jgi:hypothetical protein
MVSASPGRDANMKTKKKATRATKLATVFLRRVNDRGSLTLTF